MTSPSDLAEVPPIVTLTPTIQVRIEGYRTDQEKEDGLWVADDGTIAAFIKWQVEQGIFALPGGLVGPGRYNHVFLAQFEPEITAWFASRLAGRPTSQRETDG